MKIGDIEGTSQEINDLFQNEGLDIGKYLKATPSITNKKYHNIGLILAISGFLIINICIWTIDVSETIEKISIVVLLALICLITVLIHQRYDKIVISGLTALFAVVMSVCLEFITPKEALNKIDTENPFKEKNTE
jgi:SNF family Na+-dependent transporter